MRQCALLKLRMETEALLRGRVDVLLRPKGQLHHQQGHMEATQKRTSRMAMHMCTSGLKIYSCREQQK